MRKHLRVIYPAGGFKGSAMQVLLRSITKRINRKAGRVETAQGRLGHTRAHNDAEDYREGRTAWLVGLSSGNVPISSLSRG